MIYQNKPPSHKIKLLNPVVHKSIHQVLKTALIKPPTIRAMEVKLFRTVKENTHLGSSSLSSHTY